MGKISLFNVSILILFVICVMGCSKRIRPVREGENYSMEIYKGVMYGNNSRRIENGIGISVIDEAYMCDSPGVFSSIPVPVFVIPILDDNKSSVKEIEINNLSLKSGTYSVEYTNGENGSFKLILSRVGDLKNLNKNP